jgi:tetratricopeptide (TPR) repeat protein
MLEELGVTLAGRAELDSALALRREALRLRETLYAAPHVALARSHHALAAGLSGLGRPEAGAHFAEAASQWKATVGARHPNYASTLNNWAIWHANAGRADSAEALYREAVAIDREVLGRDSPSLGSRLSNLGRLALDQGRYDAAAEWLDEAVELLARADGPDLRYAAALTNHGQLAFHQGQWDLAEERLRAGRAVFAELHGDPSLYTAASDAYLARVSAARGEPREAERLFAGARTVLASHLPATMPRLIATEMWHGTMLCDEGDGEAGAALLEQAVRRAREHLPEVHPVRREAEAAWSARRSDPEPAPPIPSVGAIR